MARAGPRKVERYGDRFKASWELMMTTLGILAIAATEAGPPGAETRARRVLDQMIADGDTPGLQYLFVSADAVLYSYQAGMANLVDRVPVTDRTTFNAYSVVKTFTAAAILKLAGQGKLDIGQPGVAVCAGAHPRWRRVAAKRGLGHWHVAWRNVLRPYRRRGRLLLRDPALPAPRSRERGDAQPHRGESPASAGPHRRRLCAGPRAKHRVRTPGQDRAWPRAAYLSAWHSRNQEEEVTEETMDCNDMRVNEAPSS